MALLASSPAPSLLYSPLSHTPKLNQLASPPRCSIPENFVKQDLTTKGIPRRAALLRLGCGLGLLSLSLVSLPEIGQCATERKRDDEEPRPKFYELENSSGVKALDIRQGTGASPGDGDKVEVHYYGRLAAKQGWRFDSTYDHKDLFGNPEPYVFIVGDASVIRGMNSAVRTMKEGGVRRVVIPPSQGYQDTSQGPVPPDYFDRQRLYTTIFNQTRLANGEGQTLGTLIFDIELVKVRKTEAQ